MSNKRRNIVVGTLTNLERRQIAAATMDPKHAHLDALMNPEFERQIEVALLSKR